VYPNLGYLSDAGWSFDRAIGGVEYAQMALEWRAEGAQIVGGCCGVGPEHIGAARTALEHTAPGRPRRASSDPRELAPASKPAAAPHWTDDAGRGLFPLPFPDLIFEPGVFVPTQGSFLVWRHLFGAQVGAGARCLDIGCGSGLQTVQLARNGAQHVHAIDLDPHAVANTLTNAFRNGVSERLSGATVDLYPWVPDERYEVIVASLAQRPADPFQHGSSHRRPDYWGRALLEQLIAKLPLALAAEGVAYVVQLSILSRQHTAELLAGAGLAVRVVDHAVFAFPPDYEASRAQIGRVEALSDAHHLTVGEAAAMVAYLLEIRHDS